jgi:hypothetical protein
LDRSRGKGEEKQACSVDEVYDEVAVQEAEEKMHRPAGLVKAASRCGVSVAALVKLS